MADPAVPPGGYDVGYRKPPQRTRFKPGQSGNPAGKCKPRQTASEQLDRILEERITITENGGQRRMSKRELFLRQVVNKAMTGDRQYGRLLMEYLQRAQGRDRDEGLGAGGSTDAFLLAELTQMLGKPSP